MKKILLTLIAVTMMLTSCEEGEGKSSNKCATNPCDDPSFRCDQSTCDTGFRCTWELCDSSKDIKYNTPDGTITGTVIRTDECLSFLENDPENLPLECLDMENICFTQTVTQTVLYGEAEEVTCDFWSTWHK